ncbi:aquaporin Z [Dactylosporangium siamense]|uniref:Aquaporin Z n=1 Tax=Dactylosporangium siamense TaxID=685454 RepID=A0A919UFX8_9ACTN|nr:aquaporin Z [Dactylosporangium siamense]GIG50065.1 aquaporin Z [Dactylosporangium siamense]
MGEPTPPGLGRRLAVELIGTFWLVFAGCGTAVLSARFDDVGVGLLGVALAFGLAVLTGAYAFGHISGGHFNPAVTVALWLGRRTPTADVLPYIVVQLAGALAAAAVVFAVAEGRSGYSLARDGLATNGYGTHSPGGYGLGAALLIEAVLTAMFALVILGATDRRAPRGMGPLAIGLTLTVIHLISIPVTNTSVNPARSTGPALIAGGAALTQLWLFWVAPLVGAVIAGIGYRYVTGGTGTVEAAEEAQDVDDRPL